MRGRHRGRERHRRRARAPVRGRGRARCRGRRRADETRSTRSRRTVGDALAVQCDVTDEAQVRGARRRGRGPLRTDRSLLFERGHRRARRCRRERRDLEPQHQRQRHGARLRGARPGAAHDRTRRRLPPADRVGRRACSPRSGARRIRSRSTRRSRWPSGCRSPTASRGSRCRCSRRRPSAPR